jgi:hypothetical protein
MRTKALTIFITIVVLSLCLIVFALTIDADAAELSPDCPHPWLRPFKAFVANAQQCLGPFCGQEHSGPGGER